MSWFSFLRATVCLAAILAGSTAVADPTGGQCNLDLAPEVAFPACTALIAAPDTPRDDRVLALTRRGWLSQYETGDPTAPRPPGREV